MYSICHLIRQERIKKGLTQKKLAELSGVAAMTISQYERGRNAPKLLQLQRIANALGTPLHNLLSASDITVSEEIFYHALSDVVRRSDRGLTEHEQFLFDIAVRIVSSLRPLAMLETIEMADFIQAFDPYTLHAFMRTVHTAHEKGMPLYEMHNVLKTYVNVKSGE
jgi:transcriptional regulator with XRE-family HTH domain